MDDADGDLRKRIEAISLVDLSSSSSDDLLMSSSSSLVDTSLATGESDLKVLGKTHGKENLDKFSEETGVCPVQPKKRAPEKVNLRKSLAWDNAFFTDEGVLDLEELAMVNSTFKKSGSHVLPVIEEDMRRSFESNATLDSDNLTVESLESELFGNLRASVQKSWEKGDETQTTDLPGERTGSRKVEAHGNRLHEQASRKTEIPSKGKPPVTLKRDSLNKLRPNETPKELSSSQKKDASGKGYEKLTKQHRILSGVTKLSRPEIMTAPVRPGLSAAPIKKTSIPRLVERNTRKSSDGNYHGRPLETHALEESQVTPKFSCGSSSLTASNKCLSSASGSSNTRLNQTPKFSFDSSRRKMDNVNPKNSSKSGLKSPLTSESKVNTKRQKIHLKLSSSVSPNSSLESVDSSCSFLSAASVGAHSLSSYGPEDTTQPNEEKSLHRWLSDTTSNIPGARSEGPSVGSIPKLSRPSDQYTCANASSGARLSKPSGLRIPRPKKGYFDKEKSHAGNSSKPLTQSRSTSMIGRSDGMLKSTPAKAPTKSKIQDGPCYSTLKCLDPSHELSLAPPKPSEEKPLEPNISLEENFKGNNFKKEAFLTSEKPSPCISKKLLHQDIHYQLAENIGKENLSLIGKQTIG